jgi:hypothetical protein
MLSTSFIKYRFSAKIKNLIYFGILCFPSSVWIYKDRSIYVWDQALYGTYSINLYHYLSDFNLQESFRQFIETTPWNAPLSVWYQAIILFLIHIKLTVEQCFLVGNILLLFLQTQIVGKILIIFNKDQNYKYVYPALFLCSPLLSGILKTNFGENMQVTTIIYFIYQIILFSAKVKNKNILNYLDIFALLNSFFLLELSRTQNLFITLPLILIFIQYYSVPIDQIHFDGKFKYRYLLSILFWIIGIFWYMQNWKSVFLHARSSTRSIRWGSSDGLLDQIYFWAKQITQGLGIIFWPTLISVLIIIIRIVSKIKNKDSEIDFIKFQSLILITIVWNFFVLIFANNTDPRFMSVFLAVGCLSVTLITSIVFSEYLIYKFLIIVALSTGAQLSLISNWHASILKYDTYPINNNKLVVDYENVIQSGCVVDQSSQILLLSDTAYLNSLTLNFEITKNIFIFKRDITQCNVIYNINVNGIYPEDKLLELLMSALKKDGSKYILFQSRSASLQNMIENEYENQNINNAKRILSKIQLNPGVKMRKIELTNSDWTMYKVDLLHEI